MFSFFLILILALFPIILLTTIILLVTKKSKETFENKIRAIYCYIIILACIISVIFCIISIINNITEILLPDEDANINYYYRNLILAISTVIILLPLSIYHKKKIQK